MRRARAHHEALGIVGGEEITAVVGIGVMAIEGALPGERLVKVGPLAYGLVERQRGPHHAGEVRGQPGQQQPPGAPGMPQPVAAGHFGGDEAEGARRHFDPARLT